MERFFIKDLESFINSARTLVYNSFGAPKTDDTDMDVMLWSVKPEEEEEFNRILSYDEALLIAHQFLKKQQHKTTKEIRYVLDENIFMQIIESLNDRMVSNMLNKMASDGIIESGFDEESNDFVFWIKKNDETNNTETS